jgi:hypothetical protein
MVGDRNKKCLNRKNRIPGEKGIIEPNKSNLQKVNQKHTSTQSTAVPPWLGWTTKQ